MQQLKSVIESEIKKNEEFMQNKQENLKFIIIKIKRNI